MYIKTLDFIKNRFGIEIRDDSRLPIEIPNAGRDDLAKIFKELRFITGAEIGVESGAYSEVLCRANPRCALYCVDPWIPYSGYRDHTRKEKFDQFYETAKSRLERYNTKLVRKFSMDAIKDFPDGSLDFVYIDANHDFINVTQDIFYWSKKVRSGGIVAGHDYIKRKNEAAHVHVAQVLNGYTDAYKIRPWFVLGLNAVIPGMVRDSSRSWFFVKE